MHSYFVIVNINKTNCYLLFTGDICFYQLLGYPPVEAKDLMAIKTRYFWPEANPHADTMATVGPKSKPPTWAADKRWSIGRPKKKIHKSVRAINLRQLFYDNFRKVV